MHPIFKKFLISDKFEGPNYITEFINYVKHPEFNEEYFEWIDVLESVFLAKDKYIMAEIGAGWGRWISRAHFACKQKRPDIPCSFIGVEAEPTHFKWLKEHCELNNIPAFLIEAAVNDVPGEVGFYTGNPEHWYGQCIGGETKVKAIDLKSILDLHDRFDLMDLDVQNFEFKILNAAKDDLYKVKRFHIGTHSVEVENQLRELFKNWKCVNDFTLFARHETQYGASEFNDGVQTWINPEYIEEYNNYQHSILKINSL